MASPMARLLLPLGLMLRERRPGPRVQRVPDDAAAGGGHPGPAGGAELRGAAAHAERGLLLAGAEGRPRRRPRQQPHLPPVHLQHQPRQTLPGPGRPPVLRQEDRERPLCPHPEQLPRAGRGLLLLLLHEQLRAVLQPLRARLPASQAHHRAAAAAPTARHQRVAARLPAPRDLPAGGPPPRSGARGPDLRLRHLHLGAAGRGLRGPAPGPDRHRRLQPPEPEARLQMSQARGQARRQAQPFREICLRWRGACATATTDF